MRMRKMSSAPMAAPPKSVASRDAQRLAREALGQPTSGIDSSITTVATTVTSGTLFGRANC